MKHDGHVVFPDWIITYRNRSSEPTRVAHVKVSLDLSKLSELAVKAASNKGRVARDGALTVRLNSVREVAQ